jgi:hypothetical protein
MKVAVQEHTGGVVGDVRLRWESVTCSAVNSRICFKTCLIPGSMNIHPTSPPTCPLFVGWTSIILHLSIPTYSFLAMATLKDRIRSLIKRKSDKQTNANTRNIPTQQTTRTTPSTVKPAQQNIQQQQPIITHNRAAATSVQAATTTGTLQVALVNNSTSNQVLAYISISPWQSPNRLQPY